MRTAEDDVGDAGDDALRRILAAELDALERARSTPEEAAAERAARHTRAALEARARRADPAR